jgi:cytochrome c biogenesis factor
MMILADIAVSRDGKQIATVTPGKFIYKRMPSSPTTEVAIHRTLRDDLYVVLRQRQRGQQARRSSSTSTRWSTGSGLAS